MDCNFLELKGKAKEQSESVSSPIQLRLIKFLGLKNFLMDKFIFRRKESKYRIYRRDRTNHIYSPSCLTCLELPFGYSVRVQILESPGHSVPTLVYSPKKLISDEVIVYAHGNSSDMSDALKFVKSLVQIVRLTVVIFDYSGYGESRVKTVGQEVICHDLEMVLAWLNRPMSKVILLGFSLGSYPCMRMAAKYHILGTILMCPIGSIACFFEKELPVTVQFEEDYFANIKLIEKVNGKILMMHSKDDEIIPVQQAKLLYEKYKAYNTNHSISFMEISKLKHNGLHKYLSSMANNSLQKALLSFISGCIAKEAQPTESEEELEALRKVITLAKIEEEIFIEEEHEIITDNEAILEQRCHRFIKKNCFC